MDELVDVAKKKARACYHKIGGQLRFSIPLQEICGLVSGYLEETDPFFWFEEALFRKLYDNYEGTVRSFMMCDTSFIHDFRQEIVHTRRVSELWPMPERHESIWHGFLIISARCNRVRCFFFSKCKCSRPLTADFLEAG